MPQTDHEDAGAQGNSAQPAEEPRQKRLPSADSIISETTLTSPKGRVYRVIRTNQQDPYDEPAIKAEGEPAGETGKLPEDKQARSKRKRPRGKKGKKGTQFD